jgi:hypothetical protein
MEITSNLNPPIFVFGNKTEGNFDQKLLSLFELDDKNQQTMVNLFLKPKHILTYNDINDPINKPQILPILTNPKFIEEINKKIKFYLSIISKGEAAEKYKRLEDLLKDIAELNSIYIKYKDKIDKKYNEDLLKYEDIYSKYQNDIDNLYKYVDSAIITRIVQKTELLGDVILYLIVDEIIQPLRDNEYQCKKKLKNFLNSNIFLYNIINKLAPFNLADIFPINDFERRLANRSGSQRSIQENLIRESKCIDFKYYANLFEQIIGYLFIKYGYNKTLNIFENVIKNAGFIPKGFLKDCIENRRPYEGMILQPGCSCKGENGKRVCDNPGVYDPITFKNAKCPSECPEDIEMFINSDRMIQNNILYSLRVNERVNFIKSIITNPSLKFFSTYVFQNRQYDSLKDIPLYQIFMYLIDNSKRFLLPNTLVNFIYNLIDDMNDYYKEYYQLSDEQYFKESIAGKKVRFPETFALYNRYMNNYGNLILKNDKDAYNKMIDYSFSNYITDYINKFPPEPTKFTIGTNQPGTNQSIPKTSIQTQKQQEQRSREMVQDTRSRIRERSRSRSRDTDRSGKSRDRSKSRERSRSRDKYRSGKSRDRSRSRDTDRGRRKSRSRSSSREKKSKRETTPSKIDMPETKGRNRSPINEESTSKRIKPSTTTIPSPAPPQGQFNIGKKVETPYNPRYTSSRNPPSKRSTPRYTSKK